MLFYNIDKKTLKIKSFFLIILGEHDNNRNNSIIRIMNEKGKCVQIMEKTYILSILDDNIITTSALRAELNPNNNYIFLILKLDSNSAAAWCLKTDKSNYLKSVFEELRDN